MSFCNAGCDALVTTSMRVAWLVVAMRPDINNSEEKRAVGRFMVATIGELRQIAEGYLFEGYLFEGYLFEGYLFEGYLFELCNDYTSLTRSEVATGGEVARAADPPAALLELLGRLDPQVLDASA